MFLLQRGIPREGENSADFRLEDGLLGGKSLFFPSDSSTLETLFFPYGIIFLKSTHTHWFRWSKLPP